MRRGFSLVELSIVLVILGLLVGGILAGQSLIRASELRAVTNEFHQLNTAVAAYRDKYMALPGDHNNAFAFFGTNCATTALDCNGNGNGLLTDSINGASRAESWRAIQELALAGLIPGQYTGIQSTPAVAGVNAFPSKMRDAMYWPYPWIESAYYANNASAQGNQNYWHLGGKEAGNGWPGVAVLRPEEAWNIDTKMDDGIPATGVLIAGSTSRGCASGAFGPSSIYALATNSIVCSISYKFPTQ